MKDESAGAAPANSGASKTTPKKADVSGSPMREVRCLIGISSARAVITEAELNEQKHRSFPGVFELTLVLSDPEQPNGSLERKFLCLDGDREAEVRGQIALAGACWQD